MISPVGWLPILVPRMLYTSSPESFIMLTVEAAKVTVLLPVEAG
jgi:hypothetical protein